MSVSNEPVGCQGFLVKHQHGGSRVITFSKKVTSMSRNIPILIQIGILLIVKSDPDSCFQVKKRFFILRGNVLTMEKRSGTSDASIEKGKIAITGDTLVEVLDAGSNLFEFQLSNFRSIKSSKSSGSEKLSKSTDEALRLGATSGEERDMWVRVPYPKVTN
jgi:hypothetical protein